MPDSSQHHRLVLLAYLADWQPFAMVPRLLRQAGYSSVAFGPAGSLISRSRYTDKSIDAGVSASDVLMRLKDHLTQGGDSYTRVIFCDDPILHAIHRTHDEEWLRWLPVRSWESFDILMSKALQMRAGEQVGLCVPRTRLCGDTETIRQAATEIGFPLIVKLDGGTGGRLSFKAEHMAELNAKLAMEKLRYPVIVQQFVAGKVGCTSVVYANGVPLSMLHSTKHTTHPGPYGPSTSRIFHACSGAETLVLGVGQLTRFDGLAGIDWVEDASSGEIKLLELNPRPISCVHLGPLCGQNPSSVIGCWLEGRDHKLLPQTALKNTVYLFPKDLIRCFHVDLRGLRHWISPFSHHDIPWNDPPVLAELTRQMLVEGGRALRNKIQGTLSRTKNPAPFTKG